MLQRLSICPKSRQPLFTAQEPQRPAQRVRGALTRSGILAKDSVVFFCRVKPDPIRAHIDAAPQEPE